MTLERSRRLIGGVWRYVTADESGGGGSQPGAGILNGPYHVDFTDVEDDQDDFVLFTPTAGQIVLHTTINPRTFTPPVGGGDGPCFLIGQASELPSGGNGIESSSSGSCWAGVDSDLFRDSEAMAIQNQATYPDSAVPAEYAGAVDIGTIFPLAEPVVCRNNSGGTLTAGAIDVYFVIAEAVAP